VLLTPLFEEILFRGLLFFTLRNRFGAWNSALMSSLFFSLVHFYSLPGFLMTFWSGFVWAIAFERTGSLLPGIAAHAIYNLYFVAGILLIYH
jgi:membrane protease YdiL (CAAX protease family)